MTQTRDSNLQVKPRTKPTYSGISLLVPVDKQAILAMDKKIHGESCFSHLWDMEQVKCRLCADKEMCGLMYHARQKKLVRKVEAENGPFLDVTDFEGINKDELMLWIKLGKGKRTLKDLIDKVGPMSKCDDADTVLAFCRSWIIDNPRLKLGEAGVIILK